MTDPNDQWWAPIDPNGAIEFERMAALKADVRLTKSEKDAGWQIDLVTLVRADANNTRQRLPHRRESESVPATHIYAPGTAQEIHEHMTLRIGRYEDGRIGEVFIDYTDKKMYRNERAKNLGHDIATILSIALQYGAPIDVLREAVGRGEVPYLGQIRVYPHTPIGTVLDALAEAQSTR